MKIDKLLTFAMAAATLLLLGMTGCGGGKGERSGDSTPLAVDSLPGTMAEDGDVLLCADSIYLSTGGSLSVGMPVNSLPPSVDGLYDSIEHADGESIGEYHFLLGDEYMFTALDFGDGRLDLLMANTFRVKASMDGGEKVSLSVPFSNVLALPGVRTEWCDIDDTGMWYWTWRGLWFAPDQSHLTPALSTALYNEDRMPEASDFDESVIVGYFGTGCPF